MNKVLCKDRVGNNYSAWTSLLSPKLIHPTASLTSLRGCLPGISYLSCLKQSCWTRQHIWSSYFTHLTEQLHYFSNRSGQKLKSSFTPFSHTSHPILQQILSLYLTSLRHIQNLTNSPHYCPHSGINQCYHHFPGKQLLPKGRSASSLHPVCLIKMSQFIAFLNIQQCFPFSLQIKA